MVLQDIGAKVSAMSWKLAVECGAKIIDLDETERVQVLVGDLYVTANEVARIDVQLPCLASEGKPPVEIDFYLLGEGDLPEGTILLGRHAVSELGHASIFRCEICARAKG
jgi:hypothetical protein